MPKTGITQFCQREFKILQKLEAKYSLEFLDWIQIAPDEKVESLMMYVSDYGYSILDKKWLAYNYKPKEYEQYEIGDEKLGEEYKVEKKKSKKDFLD